MESSRAPSRPGPEAGAPRTLRCAAAPWLRLAAALLCFLTILAGGATPAWSQRTVGPPPLAPTPPPPRPEQVIPAPGEEPRAPEPPGLTAPRPPAFEFLLQEPLRPDPVLGFNPLAVPRQYLLRAVVAEEFDDNVRNARGGQKQGDLSTIFSLGGMYRYESPRAFFETADSIGARYSPRFSDRQGLSSVNVNAVGGYLVTPRLGVGVSESFTRSNDVLAIDPLFVGAPAIAGAAGGRAQFIRNAVSPQVSYLLTDRTAVVARYANTLVIPEEPAGGGSSTTNTMGASLSHQFTDRTTGLLGYDHIISRATGGSFHGDDVTAGVSHVLSPRMTLALNGSASIRNPELGAEQSVFAVSVGATRALSPTFRAGAAVGFQDFVQKGVKNLVRPTYNAFLAKEGLHYRITATAAQDTSETFGQVINIGFVRSQRYSVTGEYFPTAAWLFTLQGTYARANFSQAQNLALIGVTSPSTIEKFYTVSAALTYRLTRYLGLSLSYGLVVRDSSQALSDTSDNRVAFSIFGEIWR